MKSLSKVLAAVLLSLVFATSAFAAKYLDHTAVLDVALNAIKNGGTIVAFCTQQPTTYANVTTYCIASKGGLTSASYTSADHTSGGGRQITVAAQTAMTPTANGTITYGCIVNGTTLTNGSILYACTTVTSQAVTTSQTWDSPAFVISIQDPI